VTDQSITHYVDVSVSEEGTGVQPAAFGAAMFMHEHALDADRLAGPFTTAADVIDAGHASGSPPHLFAQAVAAQQPKITNFYIGRIDSGDTDVGESFDAILAENTGAWYAALMESRDEADILDFAAAVQAAAYPKIGISQCNAASLLSGEGADFSVLIGGTEADGTYRLTFTGFGLASPVNVDVVRAAGSPATNALLGDAMRTALTTAGTGPGGSLFGEIVLASIGGTGATVTFRMVDGLAPGTVTATQPGGATITVTTGDVDIGSQLFLLQYTRHALMYHPTDTDYLDAAWVSRCLSANLDVQKNVWSYKNLNGVSGTSLSNAEVAVLRSSNVNYFAPAVMSAGNPTGAFTAQGWMSSGTAAAGRRIDRTITLDWAKARIEEALANVLLRETHGVPYTDAGINRFAAAVSGVFRTGIAAGHFVPFVVPTGEADEGTVTPSIVFPRLRDTTTTQRAARTLSGTALAYVQAFVEKVEFSLEVRQ
jgi:hypothetical protein